ncbi:MAG: WYL domain-containing protein [Candidatus Omnitrophica bacterium]|nr:WYL domain-containing protein [Candidatus Omnitrophota bacterium]
MNRHIREVDFIVFDTETTGLDPASGDRIIELAAIRLKGSQRLDTFQALVNPLRPVSPGAFAVNKISQEMLEGALTMDKVMPQFLEFIRDSCLCSYNAGFDLEFLNQELRLLGKPPLEDAVVLDVLKMARRLLPGLERYALWFVAEKLDIKIKQEHRALSDVELTIGVFERFKELLSQKGVFDFTNLTHLFSISPKVLEGLDALKIAEIQEAIELGVKLKIRYLSSSGGEVSEREVIPKQIKQERNQNYLVGFCSLRNEERTFRIDGILHLEVV